MTALLEPVSFRSGARAPSRIALAPLTNVQSAPDGSLGEDELRWLGRRADGGFGVMETCAAFVSQDGKAWDGELGVHSDAMLPGMRRLAARMGARGALTLVQLFHGGVRAPSKVSGSQPWSASSFEEQSPDFEVPRAAGEADLARVIEAFAAAARRSAAAGFGGVEVHGAHGYLPSQFLSRTMNQRTDRWGGDHAGRARLLREIVRAVRAAAPPPFTVGVRISPEDFGHARGLDLDDNLQLARWLCEDGIDFLHLSLWKSKENTKKQPEKHALPLFREVCPREVCLVAAGSVWTPAEAAALLDLGADIISLGRAAIFNPDWPAHAADPTWQPRRPPGTPDELVALDVSPTFVKYLGRLRGLVAG